MAHSIDYQKELNSAQLEAVRSTEGPYLVIAGAGSGKTRVLVHRTAYLVERSVRPEEILLLTFTRKASQEMLKRASLILDERCERVSGGTFHSFANMVLRRYANVVGISRDFAILDRSDAEDTVNLIRTKLGFSKTKSRFPRKDALLDILSKSVNKSEPLEKIINGEYSQFAEWLNEIKKIAREYIDYKHSKSILDYDDLLVYLKRLLSGHEDTRLSLSARYRYIMVDEYQDTNKLQSEIVYLLTAENKNIMVVGDDSQSIYSFRGANFRNIIDFPKIFKGTKVITLEENYRSTQPILNLANRIIESSEEGFQKRLYTNKSSSVLPVYIELRDEHRQSEYIVEKILSLREEGVELADIAVLFRSSWHSNDLEIELAGCNIPFAKYGGQKFIEAAHIKDVLSYIRVIYNIADQVSWFRLLLLLPKIGPKTAELVIEEIISQGKGFGIDTSSKLFTKNPMLVTLIELFRKIDVKIQLPHQILELCMEYYQPWLKDKYDDADKRLNDLNSLFRIAERYNSLEQFLSDMALDPPEKNIARTGFHDKDEPKVSLSTIHSAKGLEWHTVFIIYLAEGHLPSYRSLEDRSAIEEERRLFYVAATRARENLFLLKPRVDRSSRNYSSGAGPVFTQASRFLEESDILDKYAATEGDEADSLPTAGSNRHGDKKFWKIIEDFEGIDVDE